MFIDAKFIWVPLFTVGFWGGGETSPQSSPPQTAGQR